MKDPELIALDDSDTVEKAEAEFAALQRKLVPL